MPRTVPVHLAARGVSPPGARRWSTLTTMLSDDQAVHVLRALDALDELEAAAFKLVCAELACGPVIDGLIADPLTEGSRLDLLCLADTVAADLLVAVGRRDSLLRLVEAAPAGSARDALTDHLIGSDSA